MDDTDLDQAAKYYMTSIKRKGFSSIGIMNMLFAIFSESFDTESDWRHNTVCISTKQGAMIKELKYSHAYKDAEAMRAVIDEDLATLTKPQFDVEVSSYRGRRK